MLSPNRTFAWLVAGALALGAAHAGAQNYPNDGQCFPPQDLADMQPFAPADLDGYGGAPEPHQGFFFSYDGLIWSIKSPPVSSIGVAPPTERLVFFGSDATYDWQTSTADTSPLRTQWRYGNRFEYGYMGRDHGILGTYFGLVTQTQQYTASDADMVIDDPAYGLFGEQRLQGLVTHNANMPLNAFPDQPNPPYLNGTNTVLRNLPVTFTNLEVKNKLELWNTELLYVRRFRDCQRWCGCSRMEMYMGARYFDFEDNFIVRGFGGILNTSYWNTEAFNRIVGPELGGRMWWTKGRWTLETDGRFTAGFNRQNFRMQGQLGEFLTPPGTVNNGMPYSLNPTGWEDHQYVDQFAPIIEGRLNLKYELTRNVAFRVGGTFIWIDGIARAANAINYTMPHFLLDTSHNDENVWLAGANFGIEINR
jgi:hypothetical protein